MFKVKHLPNPVDFDAVESAPYRLGREFAAFALSFVNGETSGEAVKAFADYFFPDLSHYFTQFADRYYFGMFELDEDGDPVIEGVSFFNIFNQGQTSRIFWSAFFSIINLDAPRWVYDLFLSTARDYRIDI